MSHYPIQHRINPSAHRFMFATGIENSYPTIKLPDGSTKRVNEMEKTDFYRRWREDFQLVKDLGIEYLRYGAPYYQTHLAPDQYDWAFTDETFAELGIAQICVPAPGKCHDSFPKSLCRSRHLARPADLD